MNETAEIPKYLERNSNVENAVSGLDHAFKENGLDYFVIGSVARIAYMNEGVPSDEIDIVVPNINQSQKAEEILDILRAKYPTVGFDTSLTSVVQREGSEHVYQLRHGRINVEIDGEIMTPKRVNIHGVEFDTLPPATLLHTYAFVGGPFREKDWKNAIKYAR